MPQASKAEELLTLPSPFSVLLIETYLMLNTRQIYVL
jgi:hypothetical protein